jgi:hypothetical protein
LIPDLDFLRRRNPALSTVVTRPRDSFSAAAAVYCQRSDLAAACRPGRMGYSNVQQLAVAIAGWASEI